jgi:hypothetical protein
MSRWVVFHFFSLAKKSEQGIWGERLDQMMVISNGAASALVVAGSVAAHRDCKPGPIISQQFCIYRTVSS